MRPDDEWEKFSVRRDVVTSMLSPGDQPPSRRPARTVHIAGYDFHSYRERYFDASEGEEMKLRHLTISITYEGALVGTAKLREWSLPGFCSPEAFWETADGLSQEDTDAAELLGAFWEWHQWPPQYGNVVIFSRLAIDSRRDAGRKGLRRLGDYLQVEFGRRASVLLLKAFPLEFEHAVGSDLIDRQVLFDRRSRAMLRLYRDTLRVQPLSDHGRLTNWMWRPLRYCPAPARTPNINWHEE